MCLTEGKAGGERRWILLDRMFDIVKLRLLYAGLIYGASLFPSNASVIEQSLILLGGHFKNMFAQIQYMLIHPLCVFLIRISFHCKAQVSSL